ncbi:hypothetical protein, conserved [Eimeria brunetti]|uniref:Uncharacterized protein n=1 Tax=Eimeria brunetti TaxID=51314 RepID=U6LX24_9EIME|nr:hypothetical protein, conserved [Eimeria brunetti]
MLRRDWGETDVPLSAAGLLQCSAAAAQLASLLAAIRELEAADKIQSATSPAAAASAAAAAAAGTETAAAAANKPLLQPFCVDAFFVSPLTRALQTAANTFHNADPSWQCAAAAAAAAAPAAAGAAGGPEAAAAAAAAAAASGSSNVRWLVSSLLREKISTKGDIGRERGELLLQLAELYRHRKALGGCCFDFSLLQPQEMWWVPHTEEELQQQLLLLQQEQQQRQRQLQHQRQQQQEQQQRSGSSSCADSPASPAAAAAAAAAAGGCASDTASTAASEGGACETNECVLSLGEGGGRPRCCLTAAGAAARKTLERAEAAAREPKAVQRRLLQWESESGRLPLYRTVPSESNRVLELRAKILLHILCKSEGMYTAFLITHSLFLKALTGGSSKFRNAEIRLFSLICDENPRLVPL